jgi:predicted transcriptional regulator of viral defense system
MKQSMIGIHILRALSTEGIKIFSIEDAKKNAEKLLINTDYVSHALHYLFKLGWISRIKRGVYFFNSQSGFGNPPHEFEIAETLVSPSAISHWTAMHYHHLTDQTPNKIYAITPTGTSIPRSIKKNQYQFIQVKEKHYFGIEKIWIDDSQIQITDKERTLLDGLSNPQFCGDFQEVIHAFHLMKDTMDIQKIIQYALKLDITIAKRLGWILDHLGIQSPLLKNLLKLPSKGYRKLNPKGALEGPYNKKWMIQENI